MDAKKYAPATERNREPILEVLLRVLPADGDILEIASGTGEHAIFFAPHFAPRRWIPSENEPTLKDSIIAWQREAGANNFNEPLEIDASQSHWEIEDLEAEVKAIVNINMIHISPWQTCLGLMAGAGRILPSGGILYLYGPFKRNGKHTAPSNEAFDAALRGRDPQWGVRDLDEVAKVAKSAGLELQKIVAMPANNFSVVFRKN